MVVTRGKEKSASSDKTFEEKENVENGLTEMHRSDFLVVDEEDPKEDTQSEDGLGLVTEKARDENVGEMSGEEGEKVAGRDTEDPSIPVTKLNSDDNKAESEENTFEDDKKDVLFENEEDHFEHDTEGRILDEFDEEESSEDDGDAEVSGEEEDEVSEEENDEDYNQEEKENTNQDTREAKTKEDGGEAKEDVIEKSEACLKSIKKSHERTRNKKVQANRLKKVDSQDKPESSGKTNGKKRVESMGMIFMCSSYTKKDCYQYNVFGLPESKKDLVKKIYSGMRLFLYDTDLKLMYGIYKAKGPGGYNIEPKAFKRQFPSQVRFKVMENCLPLAEEKFKSVIEANYFTRTKFDCKLNSQQVKKLCKLFVASSKVYPQEKSGRSLKAEKQPIQQKRNRRQRTGDERRLPLMEDVRHNERPRKRQKKVISDATPPRKRLPAPLLSTVPSSYVYSRPSDADTYRRERLSPYRERRDRPLIPVDPYGGARDLPTERNEHYRDGHTPHLERHYAYRGGQDSDLGRNDPFIVHVDSYSRRHEPVPYRDGRASFVEPRDSYIDRRDSYRDVRDPYLGRHDSYRDGRYLDRRVPFDDIANSELYNSYRRPPLSDTRVVYGDERGVDLRDSYRRDELMGRHVVHPLGSETRSHHDIAGRDAYLSNRERPSYVEPLYTSAYPSRADVYRL